MGEYAYYIWSAYFITFALMVIMIVVSLWGLRRERHFQQKNEQFLQNKDA